MVIQYSPAPIIRHPLVKCSHPRFSYDACHICLFSQLIIENQLDVNLNNWRLRHSCLFSSIDAACHDINSECVLCYRCALPNFKELLYQFRRVIPREQLLGKCSKSLIFLSCLHVMITCRQDWETQSSVTNLTKLGQN